MHLKYHGRVPGRVPGRPGTQTLWQELAEPRGAWRERVKSRDLCQREAPHLAWGGGLHVRGQVRCCEWEGGGYSPTKLSQPRHEAGATRSASSALHSGPQAAPNL